MSAFSPSEAALEGIRLTRENPRALLAWAVLSLVISIIFVPLLITIAGPELAMLERSGASDMTPEEAAAVMSAITPLYLVLAPLGLVVQAVMGGAVLRAVLRPEQKGFGYLRLGRDELRLMVLTLLYVALAMVGVFLLILIVSIIAGLIQGVLGLPPQLVAAVTVTAVLCLVTWLSVRLSLCAAETFASERLRPFDSWRLTRGRFWSLLGCYIMAASLCVVVIVLANIIFVAIAALLMGGDLTATLQASNPDISSVQAYFTPVTLLYAALNAVLTPVSYAILVSPAAVALKRLSSTAQA